MRNHYTSQSNHSMKMFKPLAFVALFFATQLSAQSAIGGINSSAISTNSMMVSVGEIFVLPSNPNEVNSGTLGILYQVRLRVLGVEEVVTENGISVFPNPTSSLVTVEASSATPQISSFLIFDIQGKQVAEIANRDNTIDLSSMSAGVYFIKTDLNSIKPIKVVKQ